MSQNPFRRVPGSAASRCVRSVVLGLLGVLGSMSANAQALKLVAPEVPPYSYSVKGQPSGFMAEALIEMAKRVGNPTEIEFMPLARVVSEVQSGEDKITAFMGRNPEREPHFQWVALGLRDALVFATLKGTEPVADLDKAKVLGSVAIMRNSVPEHTLKAASFGNLQPVADEVQNLRKLNAHRVDAWFSTKTMMLHLTKMEGASKDDLVFSKSFRDVDLYFAASKNVSDERLQPWRDAFEAMKADGTYDKLMKKYLD